ncbi:hypothetical protein LFREDSHE_36950 [Shewanella baltica]
MNPIVKSFEYGQHTVTLETGVIARQADAAVLASMGDTTVLVTVVGKKEADAGRDFFPLTVNYQEKKPTQRVKFLVVSLSVKAVLQKMRH